MQTKKIITLSVSLLALFCCVHFASAQGYTPLVRIPGLPTAGSVNLSMYLVGIYNFLLSIVGIVAVMMLIVGGMRYITAAGNSAAIGDAKDIITNAIVGLLLALLSWVFIATINPDVLYIKKPASQNLTTYNPKCTIEPASVSNPPTALPYNCDCVDGSQTLLLAGSDCDTDCKDAYKCTYEEPVSCIADGANDIGDFKNGKCDCADGTNDVVPLIDGLPDPVNCTDVCSDSTMASDSLYHGMNWNLRIGHDVNLVSSIDEGENFSVTVNRDVYFDFSKVRDCKGDLVHFAIKFDGKPNWNVWSFITGDTAPDEWCCKKYNLGCTDTWGICCENGGTGTFTSVGCQVVPLCYLDSYMFDSFDFPIYIHTFNTVSSTKTLPGPEEVWVGISTKIGGTCVEFQKIFQVDVVSAS